MEKIIFKTEVTRIDTFRIEVEQDNAELLEIFKEYNEYITDVDDIQEFIEKLSSAIAYHGTGQFYEGFGHVKTVRDGYVLFQPDDAVFLPGVTVYLDIEEDFDVESEIITN